MMPEKNTECMFHDYFQQITYHYNAGAYGSRFFHELQYNKQMYGVKCGRCEKVYLPPRIVCPECFEKMDEWIPVGPQGTLIGGTSVLHAFPDPMTGELRKTPYGYGLILLDGASTNWTFFLEESDGSKMAPGMRVEAVFAEKRTGSLSDIIHFKTLKS
jgi:uncharacterized protein